MTGVSFEPGPAAVPRRGRSRVTVQASSLGRRGSRRGGVREATRALSSRSHPRSFFPPLGPPRRNEEVGRRRASVLTLSQRTHDSRGDSTRSTDGIVGVVSLPERGRLAERGPPPRSGRPCDSRVSPSPRSDHRRRDATRETVRVNTVQLNSGFVDGFGRRSKQPPPRRRRSGPSFPRSARSLTAARRGTIWAAHPNESDESQEEVRRQSHSRGVRPRGGSPER